VPASRSEVELMSPRMRHRDCASAALVGASAGMNLVECLTCATLALSFDDSPAETTANVSQQILIVKPKYHLTRLRIDGRPPPLTMRFIQNLYITHPTPQVLGEMRSDVNQAQRGQQCGLNEKGPQPVGD
jgi:hypothetical protein